MNQDELKRSAAQAAIDYIKPRLDSKSIIGVGTGSTTNLFIDALADAVAGNGAAGVAAR